MIQIEVNGKEASIAVKTTADDNFLLEVTEAINVLTAAVAEHENVSQDTAFHAMFATALATHDALERMCHRTVVRMPKMGGGKARCR
ncbi:MAG: hypothetical protein K6G82_00690 [Ruminococcus sp.]|nr:hypothetical protein [Ruminococcus sp.]